MRSYGLKYRSNMCNRKIYALKFVVISIFMIKEGNDILLRICYSS